ncbi:IS1 family transposase [Halobacteriovorax sp. DA5]|uniref:IS1 family transposase n=1 Tax=Halobacteriovorax sp. DA5 TaxID=2067553 RepID=UPI0011AF81FA|nr:IS1 family transposase [Halobacteriovorax sp. DA5]
MKVICPNKTCSFPNNIIKDGSYFRADDSRKIQRFRCKNCGKRFSHATYSDHYRHRRRRDTSTIEHLLCSKASMRRIARVLRIDRKTIARRMDILEKRALRNHAKLIKHLENNKISHMQFDDMITHEHTKMKPLSISLAVDKKTRLILGAEVSQIPAFGHLAKKSRKKYGYRPSFHEVGLTQLFEKIYKTIDIDATVSSDMFKTYPKFISKYLSSCTYKTYEGGRSCVAGQGELKKKGYDPLFILNHTCAMFRDSINRLVRKTWCSTKSPRRLQQHLNIFISYYNFKYLRYEINTI